MFTTVRSLWFLAVLLAIPALTGCPSSSAPAGRKDIVVDITHDVEVALDGTSDGTPDGTPDGSPDQITPCTCDGRECGDDGCGNICGECGAGETCTRDGQCVTLRSCAQALECVQQSDASFDDAVAACRAEMAEGEEAEFGALVECIRGSCDGDPDRECVIDAIQDACQALFRQCVECRPQCEGKECGPDGCGGECGACTGQTFCQDFKCVTVCRPDCAGKECGPNGCGGLCGDCQDGFTCEDGRCVGCVPSCVGPTGKMECGPDGCGGSCGTCPDGQACVKGRCEGGCVPRCLTSAGEALECGPDGCGGLCGTCAAGYACDSGRCVPECTPSCGNRNCGDNGCGGTCGVCQTDQTCIGGSCTSLLPCGKIHGCIMTCSAPFDVCLSNCLSVASPAEQKDFLTLLECAKPYCGEWVDPDCLEKVGAGPCQKQYWACYDQCLPDCAGKQCGPDGCGGVCGKCKPGQACEEFQCRTVCQPSCLGKECGSDGCGGSCGACAPGESCENGKCTGGCVGSCQGKECGPDGCGGSCGTCPGGQACVDGICQGGCIPSCLAKECGPDGCGGACGTCGKGFFCAVGGTCEPLCAPNCNGKECGPDGCGGACGSCSGQEYCDGSKCRPFRSCSDMFNCWSACNPDDEACVNECWLNASPEAQKQYMDLTKCLMEACGPNGTEECYMDAYYGVCKSYYYACITCTPNCTGRQCGADGCGGQCGACPAGSTCQSTGLCSCVPECEGRECGPNGCGGACGQCPANEVCNWQGQCTCVPSCQGKECGTDGCGGTCGKCPPGQECVGGKCSGGCSPQCSGKECGPDGCGGTCGTCDAGYWCASGVCQKACQPDCLGRQCGPDGCGGTCGSCPTNYYCGGAGKCVPVCVPKCLGKECGPDGCGGVCGACGIDQACQAGTCVDFVSCFDILTCMWSCPAGAGACEQACFQNASPAAQKQWTDLAICLAGQCPTDEDGCVAKALQGACKALYEACTSCTPNCVGKQCGPDGCGAECGYCPAGATCDPYGRCPCQPLCFGKECGPDGCGGLCGTCSGPEVCTQSGQCVCKPSCADKECGPDGCGGSCGMCPDGTECIAGRCEAACQPWCDGKECGDDGCGGSCGECPDGLACDPWGYYCTTTSNGCEPSGLPGCGGCLCEACVCGMDPFCCEGSWDDVCVQECMQCGGCGCAPQCVNADGTWRECGPDGCGGECGYCPPGYACNDFGQCVGSGMSCEQGIECMLGCAGPFEVCMEVCASQVQPVYQDVLVGLGKCVMQNCKPGPDGRISQECFYKAAKGPCVQYYVKCIGGCQPQCENRMCGDDGCGGSCGECPPNSVCTNWGFCEVVCEPNCFGKQCGPDGCGGSCGSCWPGTTCQNGKCVQSGKTCMEILECVAGCATLSQQCIQGCMQGASGQSQQLFIQLAQCIVQACGLPPSQACMEKAFQQTCFSQAQQCMMDGGVIPM